MAWAALAATYGVVALYELAMALAHRSRPGTHARRAHAGLREDWLEAVSAAPGSEVLAVQTLRNSLMSASMVASAAVLGLMGTMSLSAASLHGEATQAGLALAALTPRLAAALGLVVLLFFSLATSALAARYYHHVGYIAGMPVGSPQRARWTPTGAGHLRKAGVLYSWSLRSLVAVAPPVAFILHPVAGPLVAVVVAVAMLRMDRLAAWADVEAGAPSTTSA